MRELHRVMDIYLLDWANLLLRWLHVITVIAWIGASFYFVWLDNHLQPPGGADLQAKGVSGELWAVHGGGFYHVQKYLSAPSSLPEHLTWFKWEAYTTWLSGFSLLVLLYYVQADVYLIDKSVMDLTPATAIGAGLVCLASTWIIYDLMCRSPLGNNEPLLAAIMFVLLGALVAPAFGLRLGMPGARVVDEGRTSRDGYETLVAAFGPGAAAPAFVTVAAGESAAATAGVHESPVAGTAVARRLLGLDESKVNPLGGGEMAELARAIAASIAGYTAFTWLLSHAPLSLTATYAYVNPVVAVFLGWLLLHEPINPRTLTSAVIIVAAVVIITVEKTRATPAAAVKPASR